MNTYIVTPFVQPKDRARAFTFIISAPNIAEAKSKFIRDYDWQEEFEIKEEMR